MILEHLCFHTFYSLQIRVRGDSKKRCGKRNLTPLYQNQFFLYLSIKLLFRNTFSIGIFENLMFTIGYDRSLVCYNLTEKDVHFNLPTYAGRVTCMASNAVDSSILALGSGDGLIRVWKTASSKSMFEYTTCWQKGFRGKRSFTPSWSAN